MASGTRPETISGGSYRLRIQPGQPRPGLGQASDVYVVWDENVETCTEGGTAGIYFRQRNQLDAPLAQGPGVPEGTPWGKQLSTVAPEPEATRPTSTAFPPSTQVAGESM